MNSVQAGLLAYTLGVAVIGGLVAAATALATPPERARMRDSTWPLDYPAVATLLVAVWPLTLGAALAGALNERRNRP